MSQGKDSSKTSPTGLQEEANTAPPYDEYRSSDEVHASGETASSPESLVSSDSNADISELQSKRKEDKDKKKAAEKASQPKPDIVQDPAWVDQNKGKRPAKTVEEARGIIGRMTETTAMMEELGYPPDENPNIIGSGFDPSRNSRKRSYDSSSQRD